MTDTKRCLTCELDIPAAARKCTHCDSYQDWRRYLFFSSTILSLLVALISVLTVGAPVIKDAFTPHESKLFIRASLFEQNVMKLSSYLRLIKSASDETTLRESVDELSSILSIQLIASNSGALPGFITRLHVEGLNVISPFDDTAINSSNLSLVSSEGMNGVIIVLPSEVVLFRGYVGPFRTYGPLREPDGTRRKIRLVAEIQKADGTFANAIFEQDAPRLQANNSP